MKVFETEIFPTKQQKNELYNLFNHKRFIYNMILEIYFENDCKISTLEIAANIYKDILENDNNKWLGNMNLSIIIEVAKELDKELTNYLNHKEKNNSLIYRPIFEKKKDIDTSCIYFTDNNIEDNFLPISMNKFYLLINKQNNFFIELETNNSLLFLMNRDNIDYNKIIIYEDINKKYYLKLFYRDHYENNRENDLTIGIDMGLKHPLSCYNSNEKLFYYDIPESLISEEKRLKRLKELNINNKYDKEIKEIKKKIENSKKEFREKTAEEICRNYKIIKIEPFCSEKIDEKSEDSLLGINGKTFLKILKEKANQFNSNVLTIPSGTPTTQTCSNCGYRKTGKDKMHLSERVFICPECGKSIPRDLNAAINIFNFEGGKRK